MEIWFITVSGALGSLSQENILKSGVTIRKKVIVSDCGRRKCLVLTRRNVGLCGIHFGLLFGVPLPLLIVNGLTASVTV